MDRRHFLKATAVTALAAQGHLPLLAAERRARPDRGAGRNAISRVPKNIYTEPAAIEPITGYLPRFKPQAQGTMRKAFSAKYTLIACHGSAARSKNRVAGSLDVTFSDSTCRTTEIRQARPQNIVTTEMTCNGRFNTVPRWTLDSSVQGMPDLHFVETGTWDGKTMVVKSESWTQTHATSHPLIGRWALLPLLSSGVVKSRPLIFDMLDDSTLRKDQTLRYTGPVGIPMAGGHARLDCYAQTGWGIVPTHYLVDTEGCVQLITMSTVNWALANLGSGIT